MNLHLSREIDIIKKSILTLSSVVEASVNQSVKALVEKDPKLALEVIQNDEKIDEMEVEIEEECLKVLALHQPVAIDLRYITAVMKINSDLERIGDLSVNIARLARTFATEFWPEIPDHLLEMSKKVQKMLVKSLDSLIDLDAGLAAEVCRDDEEVDDLHKYTFKYIEDLIREDRKNASIIMGIGSISRYMERIADHTTNIAEDVIYMVKGKIQRHDHENL